MSKKKKFTHKDVVAGFGRLAFGEITDATALLFKSEEEILSNLNDYDLFNISEIKRQKGGGMEIKFFDRIKALEKLEDVIQATDSGNAASFFSALEESVKSEGSGFEEKEYE